MTPADLAKFEPQRRYATLVVLGVEGMATVIDEIIDLHDRILGKLFNSLAEMERELTIERTRAGREVARQLGRKGGRKRQMTDSKIASAKKLLTSGVPPRDVARNLGVSIPTLYRWIPASAQP
jgi:DNA invertase Pin-like site-specific DNA recombinase